MWWPLPTSALSVNPSRLFPCSIPCPWSLTALPLYTMFTRWALVLRILLKCKTIDLNKCCNVCSAGWDNWRCMVVGGVPIPMSSHTERVANFALGMIIAAKEVTNPVTGGPIQVTEGYLWLMLEFSISTCNLKLYLLSCNWHLIPSCFGDLEKSFWSFVSQIRVGLHISWQGWLLRRCLGIVCLETVNTASRMESHGLPNKIHLSPSVYQWEAQK